MLKMGDGHTKVPEIILLLLCLLDFVYNTKLKKYLLNACHGSSVVWGMGERVNKTETERDRRGVGGKEGRQRQTKTQIGKEKRERKGGSA